MHARIEPHTPLRVWSVSLGCPKTRVDTEALLGALGPIEPVDEPGQADLVLVNTCGFIQPAVEESVRTLLEAADDVARAGKGRGNVRQAGRARRRPLVVAAGCLVSRYGEDLTGEMHEVDLWLPLAEQLRWPEMIFAALGRAPDATPAPGPRVHSTAPGFAYLKIAEGCLHACAFCTIPSIRGPLKSRPRAELVAEARGLVQRGVRELVLVAQDVTAYGKDMAAEAGEQPLEDLLRDLAAIEGLERLRLMYLYPAGLTDRLLEFLRRLGPPFVPYFDIPLQHADPAILRAMGRPFARDPYKVIERVRAVFPEASLRTSLITGFPGEDETAFEHLLEFVRTVRFDHLGVFAYCAEESTSAAELPGQVDEELRQERAARIMAVQEEISAEKLAEWVGREVEVLVDAEHPEWPGLYVGRTWFQAPEVDGVTYVSGEAAPGAMVMALVQESYNFDLSALADEAM